MKNTASNLFVLSLIFIATILCYSNGYVFLSGILSVFTVAGLHIFIKGLANDV